MAAGSLASSRTSLAMFEPAARRWLERYPSERHALAARRSEGDGVPDTQVKPLSHVSCANGYRL